MAGGFNTLTSEETGDAKTCDCVRGDAAERAEQIGPLGRRLAIGALAAAALAFVAAPDLGDAEKRKAAKHSVGVEKKKKKNKQPACPTGTEQFIQVCLETQTRAAAGFDQAGIACASEGRRLPTSAELIAYSRMVTITNTEWTSDYTDDSHVIALSTTVREAASVGDSRNYRCIA